jgi:hypothetical protein
MISQDIVAQDLFYKLRSRFPRLSVGDKAGQPTYEAKEGRFFDFDAIFDGVNLGRVSISINESGSLKLYFGRSLLEDLDEVLKSTWFKFLKEMRAFAKKRMLTFDTRDIGKTNLDKRDFHYLANKDNVMSESIAYGTSMTSYRPHSTAKIIIRHKVPVTAEVPGARSRNIAHIFIQNADGERYKMKVNHLPTAEAMARHVSHGNQPYDAFGRHIEECGHNIATLSNFKRYSTHHMDKMNPDASDIITRATAHLDNLKDYVRQLGKSSHYQKHRDLFHAADHTPMELDQATMESYKEKFTLRNYNEDLSSVFPILHKIMSETNNEINLEDLVGETKEKCCDTCEKPVSKCECTKESFNVENMFSQWANMIVETQMGPEEIQQLQDLLSHGLKAGAGGESAISALESLGLSDPKLTNILEAKGEGSPDADVAKDVIDFLKATNSPIVGQLDLNQIPGAVEQHDLVPAQMSEAMKQERILDNISRARAAGIEKLTLEHGTYTIRDCMFLAGLEMIAEGVSPIELAHAKEAIADELRSGSMDKHDAITYLMTEFDISDTLASRIVKNLVGSGAIDSHEDDPRLSAHSEDDYEDDASFVSGLRDRIGRGDSIGIDNFGSEMDENAGGMGAGSVASGPMGKPQGLLAEGEPLTINGKEVDRRSLEVDGVDSRDYPDFSDAYISYATFTDGTELSDEEMDELNDRHGDLVHELAYDSLHEAMNKKPDVAEGGLGNALNKAATSFAFNPITRLGAAGAAMGGVAGYGSYKEKEEADAKAKAEPAKAEPAKAEPASTNELRDIMRLAGKKDPQSVDHTPKSGEEELVEEPPAPSMKEVAEMVMSFYNREDGTFPLGETGVRVKIEKKFGERAGELAEKLIQRLSKNGPRQQRQDFDGMSQRHNHSHEHGSEAQVPMISMAMEQDLSIIKQLAGLR